MSANNLSSKIVATLVGYLKGTLILAALYGVASFCLVKALAVPHPGMGTYAVWLAVAGGILYGIPYLGGITIAIIFFVSGAVSGGPLFGLGAALCATLLNLLFDYLVSPKIMGASTGLHPLVALLAVMIGGSVAGPVGMVLAVPVAAVMQVIIKDRRET